MAEKVGTKTEPWEEYVEVDTNLQTFFLPSSEFLVSADVETEDEYVEVNMKRLQSSACSEGETVQAFRLVLLTEDEFKNGVVLYHDENDRRWKTISKFGVY